MQRLNVVDRRGRPAGDVPLRRLDLAAGPACAWMNEDGEAYRRDGVPADIRRLDEGDFGPGGLRRQVDVTRR